jgi:ribose 5-phosphate isomerase B
MRIHLAADHAGFALKQALIEYLGTAGHEAHDCGAFRLDPDDDYPDFITPCAEEVAEAAQDGRDERGIVIGGSGQGEAMAANRVQGVRAAVFYGGVHAPAGLDREGNKAADEYDIVRLARKHNDANVLSIGARFVSGEQAVQALRVFLETPFSDDPRHARRIAKF